MLSSKEKAQILSGLQALFVANSNNTNELLTKLGALFHMKTTNWIEVDFSDWIQGQPAQNIFNDIKTAILDKYIISFGEYVEIIEPQEIRKNIQSQLKKIQEKYQT